MNLLNPILPKNEFKNYIDESLPIIEEKSKFCQSDSSDLNREVKTEDIY